MLDLAAAVQGSRDDGYWKRMEPALWWFFERGMCFFCFSPDPFVDGRGLKELCTLPLAGLEPQRRKGALSCGIKERVQGDRFLRFSDAAFGSKRAGNGTAENECLLKLSPADFLWGAPKRATPRALLTGQMEVKDHASGRLEVDHVQPIAK